MKDTTLTLKDAFEELESITETLEKGDIDLEKSIPQLKRGHELAVWLKKRLQTIENEIEVVTESFEADDEDDSGGIDSETEAETHTSDE